MKEKTIKEEVPSTLEGLSVYIKMLSVIIEKDAKDLAHKKRAFKIAQERFQNITERR